MIRMQPAVDALANDWVMAGDVTDEMIEYADRAQRREAAFAWRLPEYSREYDQRQRRMERDGGRYRGRR
jgi:hypothetical protein